MTAIAHNLIFSLAGLLGMLAGCATAQVADPEPGAEEQAPAQQPAEAAPDPQLVELLERIEAASDEIRTLKSRVRYTRLQTLTGDQQRRYGDFYYAASTDDRPTLFAVLFDRLVVDGKARPMQTWFVFDGNWLLERDHEDKSAVRRELVPKGAERSDTLSLGDGQLPIPLRLKADEVLETYKVERLKDEPFGEDQILIHLRLSPKRANGDVQPLDLWFDKKTLSLFKVVTMEDADEIELLFPTIEMNPEVEAGTFDTKLPNVQDGWQVQEVPISSR